VVNKAAYSGMSAAHALKSSIIKKSGTAIVKHDFQSNSDESMGDYIIEIYKKL